jgi:tetratricopeptide (TPR) repeat protein
MLITNVAFANTTVEDSQSLPRPTRTDPNGLYRLELLRAEISSPKSRKEEESKNKLKRMIEQVRSVRFEPEVEIIEAPVIPDEAPVLEPNETSPDMPPREMEKVEKNDVEQPNERISDLTLTRLKNSLQYPDELNDPLELGEILFSSGNTKEAVLFYQEALKRTDPNDIRLSQDRAWILFQMGNCLRNHEPPAAAETYRILLIEYPYSPWTDLAKAQRELINWRLKEKPYELITDAQKGGSQWN